MFAADVSYDLKMCSKNIIKGVPQILENHDEKIMSSSKVNLI